MEVWRLSTLPPEVFSTNPKRRLFSWCVAYKTTLGKGNCQKGSSMEILKPVSDIFYTKFHCTAHYFVIKNMQPHQQKLQSDWACNCQTQKKKEFRRGRLNDSEDRGVSFAMRFGHLSKCK